MVLFLICVIVVLLAIILYQRFVFSRGIQTKLESIGNKLRDIMENDSDEKVMEFTDQKSLMDLCGQINRVLLDRQKIRADFRRQEMSSKKMLSNISHDIKTPLTVILGYLEMMRLGDGDNPGLQKVEAKAKQVMGLINQFFTLAKIEAGDMGLEMERVNLSEVCREHVLGYYELLVSRQFTVEVAIPEQDSFVWGDRGGIDRILNNLLSNALRYGGDGRYLGLVLREGEQFVQVDVVDRGKGIEKEFADSVFERLYTMEDSRNRQIQGNGLGLTIARNLARQMGGDIFIESEPGVGTIFTVKWKKFQEMAWEL